MPNLFLTELEVYNLRDRLVQNKNDIPDSRNDINRRSMHLKVSKLILKMEGRKTDGK